MLHNARDYSRVHNFIKCWFELVDFSLFPVSSNWKLNAACPRVRSVCSLLVIIKILKRLFRQHLKERKKANWVNRFHLVLSASVSLAVLAQQNVALEFNFVCSCLIWHWIHFVAQANSRKVHTQSSPFPFPAWSGWSLHEGVTNKEVRKHLQQSKRT